MKSTPRPNTPLIARYRPKAAGLSNANIYPKATWLCRIAKLSVKPGISAPAPSTQIPAFYIIANLNSLKTTHNPLYITVVYHLLVWLLAPIKSIPGCIQDSTASSSKNDLNVITLIRNRNFTFVILCVRVHPQQLVLNLF